MFGFGGWSAPFFLILMAWTLVWKGLALWHSAKRDEKWWFIALLVINTVGILEIVYLFVIAKKRPADLFGMKQDSAPRAS